MSEFDAIRRFAERYPKVGDDAAVLDGGLLAAADVIVEGIDFLSDTPRQEVGWRAITVNVSDIAAMGGRTQSVLVSVVGPESTDLGALYEGIDEACAAYGCEVVGGDLSNGRELTVAVTVLGRCDDGIEPVLRSGARVGDAVWVTGTLGGAAAAAYDVRPRARADLGPLLAALGATAMIDVSDGLAQDLTHICEASGVGVSLDVIPVADGATEEQALTGGDDYELLFTLAEGVDAPGCLQIGTIVADTAFRPTAPGWQHRFS